jgi:hypothetical protein
MFCIERCERNPCAAHKEALEHRLACGSNARMAHSASGLGWCLGFACAPQRVRCAHPWMGEPCLHKALGSSGFFVFLLSHTARSTELTGVNLAQIVLSLLALHWHLWHWILLFSTGRVSWCCINRLCTVRTGRRSSAHITRGMRIHQRVLIEARECTLGASHQLAAFSHQSHSDLCSSTLFAEPPTHLEGAPGSPPGIQQTWA